MDVTVFVVVTVTHDEVLVSVEDVDEDLNVELELVEELADELVDEPVDELVWPGTEALTATALHTPVLLDGEVKVSLM